ncbi:hypothetical protein RB2150_18337 [Rhodobacterales bacterium HTCC2150]|nr:hypothetical protein RB2150_18337 [Rhodobacterales bacterium HTCC2150] [Rhodobacteraceae bacterium HTCC2150]
MFHNDLDGRIIWGEDLLKIPVEQGNVPPAG